MAPSAASLDVSETLITVICITLNNELSNEDCQRTLSYSGNFRIDDNNDCQSETYQSINMNNNDNRDVTM